MKAITFQGTKDIKVKEVEDPKLQKRDDINVRITSTAICGSDLHKWFFVSESDYFSVDELFHNRYTFTKNWE